MIEITNIENKNYQISKKRKFFEKKGYIYGVESKFNNKEVTWEHNIYKFKDFEKAVKWLYNKENNEFQKKELKKEKEIKYLNGKILKKEDK